MDRILLTGATGFIGQALLRAWQGTGEIAVLTQSGPSAKGLGLSPKVIFKDPEAAAAFKPTIVVHLAGAGIAEARWTAKRRAKLWASRVDYTRRLVNALRPAPPERMIAASAIGYYGPLGDSPVDESAPGAWALPQHSAKPGRRKVELLRPGAARYAAFALGSCWDLTVGFWDGLRRPFASASAGGSARVTRV